MASHSQTNSTKKVGHIFIPLANNQVNTIVTYAINNTIIALKQEVIKEQPSQHSIITQSKQAYLLTAQKQKKSQLSLVKVKNPDSIKKR